MKVMTIGNGFVAAHLPYEPINERMTSMRALTKCMLQDNKPDVLINCIGKTGRPNVDWCESHKEETIEGNVSIPLQLADVCKEMGIHLINIGSGCVYFGESPHIQYVQPVYKHDADTVKVDMGWRETDFANPKSFYSKTKYACDLLLGEMPHVTTLRIRMPISELDTERNLINKLRGYSQVIDIPNSVTFMSDLVRCVDWAVNNKPGGIFHVVNPQPLTAAHIMKLYQRYVPEHIFGIIDEDQLDQITVAKRSNCFLSSEKLRQAGFYMNNSYEALNDCMKKYIENIRRQ
jgi:dTDP-4-dehydrorhamnose reductase